MRSFFTDCGHLIRPALVLIGVAVVFLVVRALIVPEAFGQYGHYRPGSLDTARAHPISYAGQEACVLCHEDQAKVRASGKHAHVACETCHGPQAKHAADPTASVPQKPEIAGQCARCHEKDSAKPKAFPQVATAVHSGGMACNQCHSPHSPQL